MATYQELLGLYEARTLKKQVLVAVVDAADDILAEDPGTANHAARYAWAARAMANPSGEADRFLMGILVKNKNFSVAQIEGVETGDNDSAVLTNVQALVDLFALADAGV